MHINLVLLNVFPDNFSTRFSALGIETLTGYIRDRLRDYVKVKIIDSQLYNSTEIIVKKILEAAPMLIGFSLHPGTESKYKEIIEEIKSNTKEKPIFIFGNVLATFTAKKLLEIYPESLIILGEGEETLVRILESLHGEKMLNEIPNLAFKNQEGEYIFTNRKTMDLNHYILPAFDNIDEYIKRDFRIGVETSRGCNYNCNFCNRGSFLSCKSYRNYQIERTLNIFIKLSSMGVAGVNFADDDFLQGSEKYLMDMALGIINLKKNGKINKDFNFFFSARVNEVILRRRVLKMFKIAGLTGIFLGVESCNAETLNRFNKKIKLYQIEEALHILNELNLIVEAGFIMFDPETTVEQLEDNVNLIKRIRLDQYLSYPFSQLRIQPGSQIFEQLDRKGGFIVGKMDTNWLIYPYLFKEQKVDMIINTCKEWEIHSYYMLDCLKDLYRYHKFTKDPTNDSTKLVGVYLGKMRELYIEFLFDTIKLIKDNKNIGQNINNLKKRFCKLRISLVVSILRDIEYGFLNDTFNSLNIVGIITLLKDHNFCEKKSKLLDYSNIAYIYGLNVKNITDVFKRNFSREHLYNPIFRGQDIVSSTVGKDKDNSIA